MKVFYKIICKKCRNIIEKSNKPTEHALIKTKDKKCDKCNNMDLEVWRSDAQK